MTNRYIKRTSYSANEADPIESITLEQLYPSCSTLTNIIVMIRELYPYKDLIGYNSKILYFTRIVRNELIKASASHYCINYEYKLIDKEAINFHHNHVSLVDPIISRSSHYSYILPKAILLTKDNKLLPITISLEFIHFMRGCLFKEFNTSPANEGISINYFNIGEMVMCVDHDYNAKFNHLYNKDLSADFIDFISINRPSLKWYLTARIFNHFREDLLYEFVESHKDEILRDLDLTHLIKDHNEETPRFQYITVNDAILREKKMKRIQELQSELQKLNTELNNC